MQRQKPRIPPHLNYGVDSICKVLEFNVPELLQRVIATCLKSAEFRDFVAPYLLLIQAKPCRLERYLDGSDAKIVHRLDEFCEEFTADKSAMILLMIRYFLKVMSTKTLNPAPNCRTLRMSDASHRNLQSLAERMGTSSAAAVRMMIAFIEESPMERLNLEIAIRTARYNVSMPAATYNSLKALAESLGTGVNDTFEGLLQFCLNHPEFLDSIAEPLELPTPEPPIPLHRHRVKKVKPSPVPDNLQHQLELRM